MSNPTDLPDLRNVIQNAYIGYTGEHLDAGIAEAIAKEVTTRRAQPESEAPHAEPAPSPNLEDCPEDDQQWAKVDPAVAFHLIERHAEDWADAGRMMLQWHNAISRAAQLDGGQEGSESNG